MSKNQLNPAQKKILQAIENGLALAATNKQNEPFDFPCPNDYCSGRNGKREMALAWKNSSGGYSIFCHVCGQEEKMERDEFKNLKLRLDLEKPHVKTNNFPACVVGDPNYYEEEYLDDEEFDE